MFRRIESENISIKPFKSFKSFSATHNDSGSGVFSFRAVSGSLWNYVSSIGAFISFASFIFFFGIIFYTLMWGRRVTEEAYWGKHADTLEWTLPNPPPEHTFEILPTKDMWESKSTSH